MITNDAELEVVRRQLDHVEAALDSLRRDVKPKNEKLFHLMAESYLDMRESLRRDIDVYLGIDPVRQAMQTEGVIRSVDLDARTFVLRERPEKVSDLLCEYGEQTEGAVKEFLDCRVVVLGAIEKSRMTGKEKMDVQRIELLTAKQTVLAQSEVNVPERKSV